MTETFTVIQTEEKPRLRLIFTINAENRRTAKVYRNTDWNEYRVKFYTVQIDGKLKHHVKADYHTNDKQDALDTAEHWASKH